VPKAHICILLRNLKQFSMKIRFFTMLAVLFFSVNFIHAKDKQPLKAKDTTVQVNKSPIMEAIKQAEQAESEQRKIVYIRDTVVVPSDTFQLQNIDWSTPQGAKDGVIYIIAFLLAFVPRLNPKWNDWIKTDAGLRGIKIVKIIGSILVIIVPVLLFGKSTVTITTLSEIVVLVAAIIGIFGIKPITASVRDFFTAKK
jgi:hypothetical protein